MKSEPVLSVGDYILVNNVNIEFGSEHYTYLDWSGVIEDFVLDEDEEDGAELMAMVRWSPQTVKNIIPEYIDDCFDDELSWSYTFFPLNDIRIDPNPTRFTELERQWAVNDKMLEFFWPYNPETKKLVNIFNSQADRSLFPGQHMLTFLNKNLRFPINVFLTNDYDEDCNDDIPASGSDTDADIVNNYRLADKEIVKLVRLNGWDPRKEIWAEVQANGQDYVLPLIDVFPTKKSTSKNTRFFQLYIEWVATR